MEEVSDLSPAAKKTVIFAAYGLAMLRAHALERRLASLLFAKTGSEGIHKLALGALVNQFIAMFVPHKDIAESLRNLVAVRNSLTHRVSDKMLAAAKEKDWEPQLLSDLTSISSTFKDVTDILEPYINGWFTENGHDREKALRDYAARYPGIEPKV